MGHLAASMVSIKSPDVAWPWRGRSQFTTRLASAAGLGGWLACVFDFLGMSFALCWSSKRKAHPYALHVHQGGLFGLTGLIGWPACRTGRGLVVVRTRDIVSAYKY